MTVDAPPRTARSPRFLGEGRIGSWERPVPIPGPGELLIDVRANAICGTDRGLWERGASVTPGHEAAGVVAVAGTSTITPRGTLGVVYLMDFCGNCRSCTAGFTNQCLAKRADMGFTHDGGYGPYVLVHETNFFPVDASMDPAEATLLLDVMGTTGHAIRRARLVRADVTSLLVGGAGPIGLGVVAMSRLLLGENVPVLIADVQPERLALAERLGAQAIDVRTTPVAAALRANGFGTGADAAIDTTGAAQLRDALLAGLAPRGVLVCVGHGQRLDLDVSVDLIAPERAVLGSEYFPFDDLRGNLELLRDHREELGMIVTHRFSRANIADAFATFFSGSAAKVVIVP
jgi:threonine dehydrogenase-like Zn-dependent dehydrogenase